MTAEVIAREIVMDIAGSGMALGDPLPSTRQLLGHYEVGRASLRQAICLLELHGFVRVKSGAGGGLVVGAATADNLASMLTLYFGLAGATYQDLAEAMLMLYPRVSAVAASAEFDRCDTGARDASMRMAAEEHADASLMEFQAVLAASSGNPVWSLLVGALGMIFSGHDAPSLQREPRAEEFQDREHIAQAILSGDPLLASDRTLEYARRVIESYRLQTPAMFSQLIEWQC